MSEDPNPNPNPNPDPNNDWMASLDAEVKDHPSMANMKTPQEVAKAYVSAQRMIGLDKIPVPTKDDDPVWPTVYDRLGRPKDPKEYKLPEIKDLPEGFSIEKERVEAFTQKAHELGLNNRQVAALYEDYVSSQSGLYKQSIQQEEQSRAAAEKALRTELGQGYEANIELANKTMKYLYGDKSEEMAARFGNDPDFIRGMIKAGGDLSEDLLGPGAPKPGDLTPKEANKEINAIYADQNHPYFDEKNPEHKWWVDERMPQLVALANPEAE